jgi:hypothetical protein
MALVYMSVVRMYCPGGLPDSRTLVLVKPLTLVLEVAIIQLPGIPGIPQI